VDTQEESKSCVFIDK